MTEDEIVEIGARAACALYGDEWECCCSEQKAECDCGDAINEERADRYDERMSRNDWRAEVRAILTALHQAGLAVVPVEPTAEMILAGGAAVQQHCVLTMDAAAKSYRAMIRAANGGDNG